MTGEFSAPRWLASGHLQTMTAAMPLWAPPRSFPRVREEKRLLPFAGGGALDTRIWWQPTAEPRKAVVLIHGVAGSIDSRYVVRSAVAAHRAGLHVVRVNLRGAGESVPHAPALYHAGLTEDPRTVLDALAADRRVSGVVLIGYSLGGSVVLKLAGELGAAGHPVLRAVCAVSAPLDLVAVSRAIERLRSLPYRHWVLRNLIRQAVAFAKEHPERARFYDPARVARLRSIRAYDASVIVPMHGFDDPDAYYRASSAGPWLPRIGVPTLVVHAEDDPMVPHDTVTPWMADASPAVRFLHSARGGHLGWLSGLTEQSWVNTWATRQVLRFLEGLGERGAQAR